MASVYPEADVDWYAVTMNEPAPDCVGLEDTDGTNFQIGPSSGALSGGGNLAPRSTFVRWLSILKI
jgi:hypothetical protein